MEFKKFDTNAKSLLKSYLADTGYAGSDYSYYAFLCWFDDLEYCQSNEAFFIRAFFNGELRYWPPLVKAGCSIDASDAVKLLPEGSTFAFATEDFASRLCEDFVSCTNRNWSEYIYRSADFIALVGKRYSAKRNHISRFKKNYNYTIESYKESDYADFLAFENNWLAHHAFDGKAAESAKKESEIVELALKASLDGETLCDVLRVEGKIVGITIGEIMSSGNAVVLYEKADINFEGAYSFIAHEFAARHFVNCEFINRQEDMGIEGLRKSKLSYYPAFLLDKYVLTPKSRCEADKDGSLIKPCQGDSSLVESENLNRSEISSENESGVSVSQRIKTAPLDGYEFRQLSEKDFNAAMTFFKCGISKLENKLFFLNYTDDELLEILNKGYMLGAFYEGHLVATCGLDADKKFGERLSEICKDISGRQFYEYSGIMVCPYHRGKGLARAVCSKVIEYAENVLLNATLCAVVQYDNAASLSNLAKLGFKERAQADYKQYRFKYLTLDIN